MITTKEKLMAALMYIEELHERIHQRDGFITNLLEAHFETEIPKEGVDENTRRDG